MFSEISKEPPLTVSAPLNWCEKFLVPDTAKFNCFISASTVNGVNVLTRPNQLSDNKVSLDDICAAGTGAPNCKIVAERLPVRLVVASIVKVVSVFVVIV